MKLNRVFMALMMCIVWYQVASLNEQEWNNILQNISLPVETKGMFLTSQTKKALDNTLKQMPCGWPEYGIPPLAPYTNPDLEVHLVQSVANALIQLLRFRFDGLEKMETKKLKVSYINKKVKFHFNFKELKATAYTLNTNTLLDLENLGCTVRYEGSGPLAFSLENLSFIGQFKYKAPWIFGSLEIYKFEIIVIVNSVRSNIGGILGNGKLNGLINEQIDILIPTMINGYQDEISTFIEKNFVPIVNGMLKGKKIWSILDKLGSPKHMCTPKPAPW